MNRYAQNLRVFRKIFEAGALLIRQNGLIQRHPLALRRIAAIAMVEVVLLVVAVISITVWQNAVTPGWGVGFAWLLSAVPAVLATVCVMWSLPRLLTLKRGFVRLLVEWLVCSLFSIIVAGFYVGSVRAANYYRISFTYKDSSVTRVGSDVILTAAYSGVAYGLLIGGIILSSRGKAGWRSRAGLSPDNVSEPVATAPEVPEVYFWMMNSPPEHDRSYKRY